MAHPTRDLLLDAGLRVVASSGLARATVDEVTAAAGVAKGTFYVHFSDRSAFLLAMHSRFRDRIRVALSEVDAGEPGAERLLRGAVAYLEVCLAAPALKALILESRSEPATHAAESARNREFAELAAADFTALGWSHAAAAARLFCAMCAEVALAELEAGSRDPEARGALAAFVGGAGGGGNTVPGRPARTAPTQG